MKISVLIIVLMMTAASSASAQSADKAVLKTIEDLFTGMRNSDSAAVHRTFDKSFTGFNIIPTMPGGKAEIRNFPAARFLASISATAPNSLNEITWDPIVKTEGNFAQVWANYAFYKDGKFSHCGVDAFQLFQAADGNWKFISLDYTIQKDGCKVPTSISDRFK